MPAARSTTSPLVIAALALAAIVGLAGVYLMAGRVKSPPVTESPPPAPPAAPVATTVVSAPAPAARRLGPALLPAAVPRLAPAATVTPDQQGLANAEAAARRTAAQQLGLTPAETARVEAIHQARDQRRAEIEATIDPRPGAPVGEVTTKLGENARQEIAEMIAALGPERTGKLRRAEAEAFREAWLPISDRPATPPAVRMAGRRRLVFMRAGASRADEGTRP